MPSDPTPLFEPTNALLAAAKPIYVVALGVAVAVWAVAGWARDMRSDVDALKSDMADIKVLLCRQTPLDTMCREVNR